MSCGESCLLKFAYLQKKKKKKRQFQHDTSKTYCKVYGDTVSVRLSLQDSMKVRNCDPLQLWFMRVTFMKWRAVSGEEGQVMPSDSLQTSISQTDGVTSQRWRRSQCESEGVCVCVCTSDTRWRAAPGPGCSWQTAWAHVRSSWTRPAVDDIDEYCRQTEGVLMKYRTHTLWIIYFIILSFEHQSFCPQLKQNKAKDTFDI